MPDITITPEMTMEQILQVAPAAQRALFQRYHVGGCSSCGFQPSDTLAQVAKDHNILDIKDMVSTIVQAQAIDGKVQVEPSQVRAWLLAGDEFSFIDVRTPEESEGQAEVTEAERLDYNDAGRYMDLDKDRRIVFLCQDGGRSLDVASYFIGHKFTNVWCVEGGVASWS
ncbi:MAG: rhodanese-related sulfurtransferase [Planctomycetota bacterium]|jgi:rhodanese-related sulfurtransferase